MKHDIVKLLVGACSVPLVPIPEQKTVNVPLFENLLRSIGFLFLSGMFQIVPGTAFPGQSPAQNSQI